MKTSQASSLMTFALLFSSLTLSSPALADTCGQLAGVKGTQVEILRMQTGRSAGEVIRYAIRVQPGSVTQIFCDDVILTGLDSSVKIVLGNGKLTMGPESRIELAAHTKSASGGDAQVNLLNLTYGKMRALVRSKKEAGAKTGGTSGAVSGDGKSGKSPQASGQTTFRVRTFSAVAGVRGTDFYTSYDPNTGLTEQATIEGAVEVKQSGTEQAVVVSGGQQVQVETTPQAVAEAPKAGSLEASKTGGLEAPKVAPEKGPVKPLLVTPIQDSIRQEIRVASSVAKDDPDFSHKKAIETLGKPETWTIEKEPVPEKLKEIKNEF